MIQYGSVHASAGNGSIINGTWANGQDFIWYVGYRQHQEIMKIIRNAGGRVNCRITNYRKKNLARPLFFR